MVGYDLRGAEGLEEDVGRLGIHSPKRKIRYREENQKSDRRLSKLIVERSDVRTTVGAGNTVAVAEDRGPIDKTLPM